MTEAQKNFFEGMTKEQKDFFGAVLEEMGRAEEKHKRWPEDAVHASAILNEEAGKLTQASIDYVYRSGMLSDPYERMNKRAVSVAAMALRYWHGMGTY